MVETVSPVPASLAEGHGLFLRSVESQDGPVVTNMRLAGGRRPGAALIAAATALLFVLGAGLFAVSLAAQYQYVLRERHQATASVIEAVALDLGMAVFSLLALGLARAGKPAKTERALIMACAAGSAIMNYAAADVLSPRSILAYCMPPVFLAVVADRVVAVIRRHVLGSAERSPWTGCARVALYGLRLVLAPPSTAAGLRRRVLDAAEVPARPAASAGERKQIPAARPASKAASGSGQTRDGSKTARFLALVTEKHGALTGFPLGRVSSVCTELAPEVGLNAGAARTALRRAVLAAQDGGAK